MPPAPPNGDTALTIAELERVRSDGARPTEAPSPRRLLAKDGLHVGSDRPSAPPEQADERALLALVSSARHELRAPLQSIQGFAELLATESYGHLGGDQRVFVEHIIQGSADLSRALDACFDLLQVEVLHLPTEPLRSPLRPLLDESISIARGSGLLLVETEFSALNLDLTVEVDLQDFAKSVNAIITALLPLVRGALVVSALPLDGRVEVTFAAVPGEVRAYRPLHELPRRGLSARALLWLRLAGALLARSGARLETSEGYDRVRVSLPCPRLTEAKGSAKMREA